MKYELRQIDAWGNKTDGYDYNETFHIGTYNQRSDDGIRSFLRGLHKYGITCKRGVCRVEYDGDIYELIERKTDRPIICAVPMDY